MSHAFVHETENNRKKRFVALIVMTLLVVSGIVMTIVNFERAEGKSTESFLSRYTPDVVHNITPMKQFILGVVSGVVFIPIPAPIELTYYVGLRQGNPMFFSLGAALLGIVIGSCISYVCGWKLSKHVVYLLSTKHIYAVRRKVNTYGIYAIILFYTVPAPGDVLSFSLGVTRYNIKRLLFFMIVSVVVKLLLIAAFFHYVQ